MTDSPRPEVTRVVELLREGCPILVQKGRTCRPENLCVWCAAADALLAMEDAPHPDAQRFDFLERRHAQLIPCQSDADEWDGWNVWDDVTHRDLGDGDNARDAIDAAMKDDAARPADGKGGGT